MGMLFVSRPDFPIKYLLNIFIQHQQTTTTATCAADIISPTARQSPPVPRDPLYLLSHTMAYSLMLRSARICRLHQFGGRALSSCSVGRVGLPDDAFKKLETALKTFMETEIYPNEKLYEQQSKEIEQVRSYAT